MQQILESGVGAPAAEKLPNVVEVVRQEFTGEVQRERFPEIELFPVRYRDELLAVVDVIRQYVQVIAELGMTMELSGLLAQKGLMLAGVVAETNSNASRMSFKLTRMVILTDDSPISPI